MCIYEKLFPPSSFFSFRHHQLLIVLFYNLLMYQTFRWRGQVIDVTGLTWKWPYKAVLIVCFVFFFWPASYNITLLPLFSMDKRIRATHQCQRASPSSIINVFFCSVFPLYTQNAVHLASAIITKELITNSYITNDTDTFDYYLFHHLSYTK